MKPMRQLLIVLFTLAVVQTAPAQNIETDNLENLVFPTFQESLVKLKNGQTYETMLNYEKTEQQMVVLRNNQLFLFKDHLMVDSIYMGERVFIPSEKGFLEVLINAPVSLFMDHKARLESTGATLAYGSKTTTAGVTHITTIFGQEGAIILKIPENFKIMDDSSFLVRIGGELHKITNRKQFLKLFPEIRKKLEAHISDKGTDFKSADDLISLIGFCNSLSR